MLEKRTKVVATLGPATRSAEMLSRLVLAGVDIFRLNFSHGTADEHRRAAANVREVARRYDRTVAILQDLQGPKIRVGKFAAGKVELAPSASFTLTPDPILGDPTRVSVSYADLPRDVEPGQTLLLDDGKIRLRIRDVTGGEVHTTVEVGGTLSDHKGLNVPGADLSIPALTDKDLADLAVGAELGVDWVAVSFVRTREDVLLAREELARHRSTARLMAKIEKPGALSRFAEILDVVDGIMVARGDLGVEMAPEDVPLTQKRLIALARAAGKPVITATQMLESMITSPRPTRAEASDVANAIFDGTDAVMLSAETAVGSYPVEAVEMMGRVARSVEGSPEFFPHLQSTRPAPLPTTQDAIALAACEVASSLSAAAIVVLTTSGSSALRVARNRPPVPVLALTADPVVQGHLALSFGVAPHLVDPVTSTDEMVRLACRQAVALGLASPGDRIVITAGLPLETRGTTNLVRVERVREDQP